MTAQETIEKYLKTRKTFATAKEIAKSAKLNYKTVKNVLGNTENGFLKGNLRKCKVSGSILTTYGLG